MGCYQIVINSDNVKQSILLFLCWFTTLIIAQKVRECNLSLYLLSSLNSTKSL